MASAEVAARPSRFTRETFLGISLAVLFRLMQFWFCVKGGQGFPATRFSQAHCLLRQLYQSFFWGTAASLLCASVIFFGLICCILASSLINRRSIEFNEIVLFGLSLSANPSFRIVSFTKPGVREAFVLLTGGIVALGTIFTTYAIIAQWDGPELRPFVFGVFDAGATFFLMVCGFLIIAVITTGMDLRKSFFQHLSSCRLQFFQPLKFG